MFFQDRRDAGRQLCKLLAKYKESNVIVYALPRGGVVVADEIAKFLNAPIDLILAHKIGHPYQPEYAVAAISESGKIVGNPKELIPLGTKWLEREKDLQLKEIAKKRKMYLNDKEKIPMEDKIAIIVDDGIATGLTMQAGIKELRNHHPKSIVIAVPVSPRETAEFMKKLVDDFESSIIPESGHFLGAVGAYYNEFYQTEDEEVIDILNKNWNQYGKAHTHS
jgi:putative phosphoribosyl transferase